MKTFYLIIICIATISCVLLTSFVAQRVIPKPKGYWHYVEGYYPRLSGGYGGAPDGKYSILIIFVNETDRVVGASYCESSPGQLHGYWHYDEDLSLEQAWCKVQLKDNIITSVEKLEG